MIEKITADEIFNEFFQAQPITDYLERKLLAKRNALICANRILMEYKRGMNDLNFLNIESFWLGVIHELEKK